MGKDKIILIDGSKRFHVDNSLEVLTELVELRDIKQEVITDSGIGEEFSKLGYNPQRNQVDVEKMTDIINRKTSLGSTDYEAGKIIILDKDIYTPETNWCFGVACRPQGSLGYIIISTARFQNNNHGKDILRHELGHMFGAPSNSRKIDVESSLGLHCTSNLCVMQQKLSVPESIKYSDLRQRANARAYCPKCEEDIIKFVPAYRR